MIYKRGRPGVDSVTAPHATGCRRANLAERIRLVYLCYTEAFVWGTSELDGKGLHFEQVKSFLTHERGERHGQIPKPMQLRWFVW